MSCRCCRTHETCLVTNQEVTGLDEAMKRGCETDRSKMVFAEETLMKDERESGLTEEGLRCYCCLSSEGNYVSEVKAPVVWQSSARTLMVAKHRPVVEASAATEPSAWFLRPPLETCQGIEAEVWA